VICGVALVAAGVLIATVEAGPTLHVLPAIVLVLMLPSYPLFLAVLTRWRLDGIRIGGLTLSSRLRRRSFVAVYLKLLGASAILLLLCGAIMFGVVIAIFWLFPDLNPKDGELTFPLYVSTLVGVSIGLISFGIIQRYFLNRGLWAVIAGTITVSNLAALDRAVAAGQPASSLGEGLADALDFGAGV
jgi:hypothetical protein